MDQIWLLVNIQTVQQSAFVSDPKAPALVKPLETAIFDRKQTTDTNLVDEATWPH